MLEVEDEKFTFDSFFALMSNIENEEENEVTLSDFKVNLDKYSSINIKKLANVLTDSMCEMTAEKMLYNKR